MPYNRPQSHTSSSGESGERDLGGGYVSHLQNIDYKPGSYYS
jgi:hypothetical protein